MIFPNIVQHTFRSLQGLKTFQTIDLKSVKGITRTYARWASRRPVAILNENELFEPEETTNQFAQDINISPRKTRKRASTKETKESSVPPTKEKKSKFTILKDNDHIITSMMTNAKIRKKREKNNEIVLEGYRLIQDGIDAGAVPKVILFSRISEIEKLLLPDEVQLYKVPYRTIQLWSNLSTSPGLIGIFETPNVRDKEPSNDALPLTIICDNVREPGNLGSILRGAAGVGCDKLILMKGCVDLWDPKVVRSAAGAHFRLPIHAFHTWEEIPSIISRSSNVFVADSNYNCELISEDLSINSESHMVISNANLVDCETSPTTEHNQANKSSESREKVQKENPMKQFLSKLPAMPYYAVDYTKNEVVLVVSGETAGLNIDSQNVLKERKSVRINIPLTNGVDSLNTGVALGIITFEMKRQFVNKQKKVE